MKKNPVLLKNLLLSLGSLVVFFGLFEVTLKLIGFTPLVEIEDPYVGFSSGSLVFIEGRDSLTGEKIYKTASNKKSNFNTQSFKQVKDKETYRIFTLGGSTTYGRPYDDVTSFSGWLREYLKALNPSIDWEVINVGGISYASYRVAKLTEELVKYEPDLLIVYSGHNEFLEERTYGSIKESNAILREANTFFSKSRTYSALSSLLLKRESKQASGVKKKSRMGDEVNAILANSVGPSSYKRDDSLQIKVAEHFEFSLNKIVGLARGVGAEVLLINTPSNLRNCSPFKSENSVSLSVVQLFNQHREKGKAFFKEGKYEKAIIELTEAFEIDPRHSHLNYELGQAYYKAERYKKAKIFLDLAKEEDICPLRALQRLEDKVVQVAERTGVPLLDFHRILNRQSLLKQGHELLGEEYFLDHVHLKVEAHQLLAEHILQRMSQEKGFPKFIKTVEEVRKSVSKNINSRVNKEGRGLALHNLAKVLNWAGKHEDAVQIAKQALSKNKSHLEAAGSHLLVGTSYHRKGNVDSAVIHYQGTLRLDSNNHQAHRFLGFSLVDGERYKEALSHLKFSLQINPRDTDVQFYLGKALFYAGEFEGSLYYLTQFTRVVPNNVEAFYLLGLNFKKKGNSALTRQFFERVIRLNPKHKEALAELKVLKVGQEKRVNPLQNKGKYLLDEKRKQEALKQFEKALRRH